jgi:hypothetical protein
MDEKSERFYNGPTSDEMNSLYDSLMKHIDVTELKDWPILSLHIARILYEKIDD